MIGRKQGIYSEKITLQLAQSRERKFYVQTLCLLHFNVISTMIQYYLDSRHIQLWQLINESPSVTIMNRLWELI